MAGRRWKKCFSTWCAAARERSPIASKRNGKHREHGARQNPWRYADHAGFDRTFRLAPPHWRSARALHVSLAELRHPSPRADLLALLADAHLGLLADLFGPDQESGSAGRRRP